MDRKRLNMGTILVDHPLTGVARVTINRPALRNAVDVETRVALGEAIASALGDSEVRVLVLAGAGGHLCAGGDVTSMGKLDFDAALARMKGSHLLVRPLALTEKPVVVVAEGSVAGAGVGLASMGDVVIGDPTTKVVLAFTKLGLVPDWGLLYTLSRRIGVAQARRLMLTAESLNADAALAVGIIDIKAEAGKAMEVALDRARALAAGPAKAYGAIKRWLASPVDELERALEYEARVQAEALSGAEFAEGFAAFLQKRPAKFP